MTRLDVGPILLSKPIKLRANHVFRTRGDCRHPFSVSSNLNLNGSGPPIGRKLGGGLINPINIEPEGLMELGTPPEKHVNLFGG